MRLRPPWQWTRIGRDWSSASRASSDSPAVQIATGVFSPDEPSRYRDLVDSLINFGDHYQVLADYRSYVDCQDKVDELYRQPEKWTSAAMYNIANMGYFSSDRTIKEYAETIWHIDPVRL